MAKMTDDEWQKLYENFETTWLLSAVDHLDAVRRHLADGDHWEPPEIRTDLLKLHQLAMDVVNNGWTSKAREFFDMAGDLEMQISEIIESLEFIQNVLFKLTALYPESLVYDDED